MKISSIYAQNWVSKEYSNKIQNSYLIQRLKKPINLKSSMDEWLLESFRFGGRTSELGGFDKNFAIKLGSICSFHGMGSSQYEWGVVPYAFEQLNEKNIDDSLKFINFEYLISSASCPIYVICRKAHSKSVKFRLRALAETSDYRILRKRVGLKLRDMCYLNESLEKISHNKIPEYLGWIELDNPYFFFVDKNMYEDFLNLFKINSIDFIKRLIK